MTVSGMQLVIVKAIAVFLPCRKSFHDNQYFGGQISFQPSTMEECVKRGRELRPHTAAPRIHHPSSLEGSPGKSVAERQQLGSFSGYGAEVIQEFSSGVQHETVPVCLGVAAHWDDRGGVWLAARSRIGVAFRFPKYGLGCVGDRVHEGV